MTDINELMARDPLSLTRDDISALVAEIRKARAQFDLGVKTAAKAPKKTTKPVLDLSSLGLKKKGE